MSFLDHSVANGILFIHKQSPLEREAIGAVLRWAGLEAQPVESIAEMLDRLDGSKPACLITDLPTTRIQSKSHFEGLSFEELEAPVELGPAGEDSHTLVICAACLTDAGCAFRDETVCFLKRPYTRGQLLDALLKTLACDLAHQEQSQEQAQVMQRIGALTERERQVMDLIYEGQPNKTIAGHLSLSTRTVEAARASVYRKLHVDSGIALVRLLARMEYEVNSQK